MTEPLTERVHHLTDWTSRVDLATLLVVRAEIAMTRTSDASLPTARIAIDRARDVLDGCPETVDGYPELRIRIGLAAATLARQRGDHGRAVEYAEATLDRARSLARVHPDRVEVQELAQRAKSETALARDEAGEPLSLPKAQRTYRNIDRPMTAAKPLLWVIDHRSELAPVGAWLIAGAACVASWRFGPVAAAATVLTSVGLALLATAAWLTPARRRQAAARRRLWLTEVRPTTLVTVPAGQAMPEALIAELAPSGPARGWFEATVDRTFRELEADDLDRLVGLLRRHGVAHRTGTVASPFPSRAREHWAGTGARRDLTPHQTAGHNGDPAGRRRP